VGTPDPAELAQVLAAAASDAELAAISRAATEADGTGRLREAVDLLRAAARGEPVAAPVLGAEALSHVTQLVRRDEVLEALYEADVLARAPVVEGLDELGVTLARGAWVERDDLDSAIGGAATDWRVERLAAVDRAVLRLALWELRHRPDLSTPVVISEAVRLAKAYSTERSGAFVNGVLGRLARGRADPR